MCIRDRPFALAAAATETLADGTESHVVWIASTSLLNDQYNQQVSGANQDFFLNCMGWTLSLIHILPPAGGRISRFH